jgi:hypothetical protein
MQYMEETGKIERIAVPCWARPGGEPRHWRSPFDGRAWGIWQAPGGLGGAEPPPNVLCRARTGGEPGHKGAKPL